MVSRVIPVDPFDLVIFGGTGDLARRKILPGLLPPLRRRADAARGAVIGAARSEMDAEGYPPSSPRRSPSSSLERHRDRDRWPPSWTGSTMCDRRQGHGRLGELRR
jgi:glucose-6-phosphate 1-dehydrogenase